MSEIINETINELNKPTENNIFSIEDDPVTILEKINQVERYLKEIDTHVDTSINTANEALEKANSAFEANGTLVKINGENQTTWSADFAESERQKSKNLFTTQNNSKYGSSGTYNIVDLNSFSLSYGSGNVTWSGVEFIINNLKPNTTYNFSLICEVGYSLLYFQFSGLNTASEILAVYGGYLRPFNTGDNTSIKIRVSSGNNNVENTTFNITNVQLEQGSTATDYQPYHGEIVHQVDIAPVVLYDKSTHNVFFGTAYPVGIPTQTEITSGVDFSPYKKLKVYYTHNEQYFGCAVIDLTKQTFSTEGGNGTWCCLSDDGNAICAATFQVKTNSFKCTANGFTKLSPLAYNSRPTANNSSYYIYRIEGIK